MDMYCSVIMIFLKRIEWSIVDLALIAFLTSPMLSYTSSAIIYDALSKQQSTTLLYIPLPEAGLEPAQRCMSKDFKSSVSTNSTIPAVCAIVQEHICAVKCVYGGFECPCYIFLYDVL